MRGYSWRCGLWEMSTGGVSSSGPDLDLTSHLLHTVRGVGLLLLVPVSF